MYAGSQKSSAEAGAISEHLARDRRVLRVKRDFCPLALFLSKVFSLRSRLLALGSDNVPRALGALGAFSQAFRLLRLSRHSVAKKRGSSFQEVFLSLASV